MITNMNNFFKVNKTFLTYSLITIIILPIVGINFFISFLGNIILLLFLIPLLLFLILLIVFNSYKSKINRCDNCGTLNLGLSENCMNCGVLIKEFNNNQINQQPSESTIEVKAEEIK